MHNIPDTLREVWQNQTIEKLSADFRFKKFLQNICVSQNLYLILSAHIYDIHKYHVSKTYTTLNAVLLWHIHTSQRTDYIPL
jgi:hypothetical protein